MSTSTHGLLHSSDLESLWQHAVGLLSLGNGKAEGTLGINEGKRNTRPQERRQHGEQKEKPLASGRVLVHQDLRSRGCELSLVGS